MEKFPQNQTPFKDSFIKSEFSDKHQGQEKLYEFKNNPNKIIRVISFDELRKDLGNNIDQITLAGLGKKLYNELEEKYGIPVPVEYVIGKDEGGEDVVYGITDKIINNLENDEITPQLAEQIEKLYISLSQYYLDKLGRLSDDEFFLTDISNGSQYAYGTKANEENAKLYLIDTDLYMRNDKTSFYYVVAWLIRHMTDIEERLDKHFEIARKNVTRIIASPPLEGLNEKEKENIHNAINEANNFLQGEFSEESNNLPTGI